MTKSDLIDLLCETRKLPKGRAELLVNTIFESMVKALTTGERIEIRGFGSFEIRNYRAYAGRNPRTGSTVEVKPKRLPFFKVGKELKDRVNAAAPRADGKPFDGASRPALVVGARNPGLTNGVAEADDDDEQPMPAPDVAGRLPSAQP
jgi:integration host factor subunit beta